MVTYLAVAEPVPELMISLFVTTDPPNLHAQCNQVTADQARMLSGERWGKSGIYLNMFAESCEKVTKNTEKPLL